MSRKGKVRRVIVFGVGFTPEQIHIEALRVIGKISPQAVVTTEALQVANLNLEDVANLAHAAGAGLIRATVLLRGRAVSTESGADESLRAELVPLPTGQSLIVVADTRKTRHPDDSGSRSAAVLLGCAIAVGLAYGAYHYRHARQDALFPDQRNVTRFVPLPGPEERNSSQPAASDSPPPSFEKALTDTTDHPRTEKESRRTWSDKTGQRQVQAEFVEFDNGVVVVKKTDGMLARVPLESLSSTDQEYVASQQATRAARAPAQPDKGQPSESPVTLKVRTWTEKKTGRQVDGTFVEVQDKLAIIQPVSGQPAKVPLRSLSDEDIAYIQAVLQQSALAGKQVADDQRPPGDAVPSTQQDNALLAADDDNSPGTTGRGAAESFWERLSDWQCYAEGGQIADFVAEWSEPPRAQYVLGVWSVVALLTAGLAKLRHRSATAWLLLGLLFPLLSAIAVILLRKRTAEPREVAKRVVIRKNSDKTRAGAYSTTMGGHRSMAHEQCVKCGSGIREWGFHAATLNQMPIGGVVNPNIGRSIGKVCPQCGIVICAQCYQDNGHQCTTCGSNIEFNPELGPPPKKVASLGSGGPKTASAVFVLGGDCDPSGESLMLRRQFVRGHSDIAFANANTVTGIVRRFSESDRSDHRKVAETFVRDWCAKSGVPYSKDRLLCKDYHNDRNCTAFVVATLLAPRGSAKASSLRGVMFLAIVILALAAIGLAVVQGILPFDKLMN